MVDPQQNDLVKKILSDYVAQADLSPEERQAAEAFCNYAQDWVAEKKPIGVSPASFSGSFSVRFADGDDLSLFTDEKNNIATTPSVRVTGNSGEALRAGVPIVDSSIGITKGDST